MAGDSCEKTISGLPPPPPPPSPPIPVFATLPELPTGTGTCPDSDDVDVRAAAYVLSWGDGGEDAAVRRDIRNAGELREALVEGREDEEDEEEGQGIIANSAPGPGTGRYRRRRRRLIVLRGLPAGYAEVLLQRDGGGGGGGLGVDPQFLAAHAGRRSYRPRPVGGVRRSGGGVVGGHSSRLAQQQYYYHCEYPEMVRDSGIRVLTMDLTAAAAEAAEAAVSPSADMLSSGPPTHAVSTAAGGDCGALFCRASFWRGPTASVLLLDRPAWEDPSSGISKRRRRSGLAVASAGAGTGTGTATEDEEEIPSFEALLAESLQLGYCESDANPDVPRLLDDIAARQWCEFFDDAAVGAQQTETSTALLWQAQSALERNLAAARLRDKMYGRGDGGDDGGGGDGSSAAAAAYEEWEALLARLGRRAQLLGQLTPIVANIQMPPSRPASPRAEYHADASDVRDQRSSSAPDENQRSLNRVSYIGGVLLPISIVSGILAMGDTYGPGGGMFYVFWAAAVPLTLLTVLVIYADSIRKAEVWIEVAAAGGSEGSPGGAAVSTPQLEQAIPYSATIDLDERMATPLPAGEDSLSETLAEPATLVEKLFPNTAGRTWRREELGWLGACATVFGIYKMGKPPT